MIPVSIYALTLSVHPPLVKDPSAFLICTSFVFGIVLSSSSLTVLGLIVVIADPESIIATKGISRLLP